MTGFRALTLALLLCGAARAAEVARAPAFSAAPAGPPVAVALPADLGLGGVTWRPNYAAGADGSPLQHLGSGRFGAAYVHPADSGLMLKVAADPYYARVARSRAEMTKDTLEEAEGTRRVAAAGAGPRLIAYTRVPHRLQPLVDKVAGWLKLRGPDLSRPALVKERVMGQTVGELRLARKFGPEERALVAALKERLAAAGLSCEDMHDGNIMIGTTASAPEVRAHLVDAGLVSASP